jgi:hypothetical protein
VHKILEESTYDAGGELRTRLITHYDAVGRVTAQEAHGPGDEFQLHFADEYGNDGSLVNRDYLSADGRIVMSLAFRGDRLLSFARAPDCRMQGSGFVLDGEGVSTEYQVHDDCTLEMIVQRHPGRETNFDNDVMERFDEAGHLLDRLTLHYDRDRYGNWTRRTISAWDPKTNQTVPIQEDVRTLTYFTN